MSCLTLPASDWVYYSGVPPPVSVILSGLWKPSSKSLRIFSSSKCVLLLPSWPFLDAVMIKGQGYPLPNTSLPAHSLCLLSTTIWAYRNGELSVLPCVYSAPSLSALLRSRQFPGPIPCSHPHCPCALDLAHQPGKTEITSTLPLPCLYVHNGSMELTSFEADGYTHLCWQCFL